ncbi:hypothetical protein BKG95_07160 [Rodentibacter pneumotropicus]|uniref:DUF4422 domain-containing protein n=1 Tax=Rodentibacter pneumotropicus TaxID=758 RepID=A0AAW5LE97_9PAST|nr:DUF4422 domain-containing protein [Rodentibacter pneumotropicus]MCQ9122358.1 DUF4422 domain-containing protein [Rodentibacter pneumotropicus]OOF67503.1 hypothetical protein BKG95_07160 [Rodentibacter pneumotropicus]
MINNDINIFIATHKKFILPEGIDPRIYIPFQVGLGDDLGYLRENNKINIAEKNPNFCELTLLYYIWKNIDSKIIGLVHYRRYLYKKNKFKKIGLLYIPWKRFYKILNAKDIYLLLEKYDLILPRVNNIFETSIKEQYGMTHYIEDWNIISQIICEKYPEYIDSFRKVEMGKNFYGCNMFISKKETITPYFEWLFDILFEAERRCNISNYSDYQKRIFGFLSERLFTVWIFHHKDSLKIYETKMRLIE